MSGSVHTPATSPPETEDAISIMLEIPYAHSRSVEKTESIAPAGN
jgi:hypothetical protein